MKLFQKLLLTAYLAALQTAAFAQIEDPERTFRDLTRLEGTWFMPTDRGDRLEIWHYENDSSMTGKGCRIKPENGDTVVLENLRLELRDTNITYLAKVRGQNDGKWIPFKLTKVEGDVYLFENPAHDDPKKIRYFLLERREIQVTTEGMRNGRPTKTEFVFEREFNPASVEFRAKGGLNVHNLLKSNEIGTVEDPKFSPRPGWELGVTTLFKGHGGFIAIGLDLGLAGKFTHAESAFRGEFVDSMGNTTVANYRRDLSYRQTWLNIAAIPEVKLKRNGRTSLLFGGYFSRLLINRVKGVEEPLRNKKLFNFNNDFKKNDFGAILGLQRETNFGKKDLEGILGLRFNFGLANVDNLYERTREPGVLYNGKVRLVGVSLTYSVNLLKV